MLIAQIPSVKSSSFNIYLYICMRKVLVLGGKDSDNLLICQINNQGNVIFGINALNEKYYGQFETCFGF